MVIPILWSSNIRCEKDTIMGKDIRVKESNGFYRAYVCIHKEFVRRIRSHAKTIHLCIKVPS